MELRNIQSFVFSAWGMFSAGPIFFPIFDQVMKIVYVPAMGDDFVLLTLNTLICSFVLLFFFLLQYQRKSLMLPFILFVLGLSTLLWYRELVSPIEALLHLGIAADISYLSGYPEIMYRGLYWAIFASFTGAFTSLAALFYRPRLSNSW